MALEEGASKAVFVEQDRKTALALVRELGPHGRVETADVFAFLQQDKTPFDIVFADPPFPEWTPEFSETLFRLVAPWLVREGIFLVKSPRRMVASPPISAFRLWKSTVVGESALHYFFYEP